MARSNPPTDSRPSTLFGLLALVAIVSCLDGGDDGWRSPQELRETEQASTECREVALAASFNPSTGTSYATQWDEAPPLTTIVPGTLTSTNPHPNAPAKLVFYPPGAAASSCEYHCPASGGVCTSNVLVAQDCVGVAVGEIVTSATVRLFRVDDGTVPMGHGLITYQVTLDEIGACPGACADLDDEDPCTIDQCDLVAGEPVVHRTNICADDLTPGVATRMSEGLAGLMEGSDPVQRDADILDIDVVRAAAITGRVRRHDGYPASGARVEVVGHPEYGWTETDGSGEFVMLVEGGGALTVDVTSWGFAPVHRTVRPAWQGWARADDIELTPLSLLSTLVDLEDVDEGAIVESVRTVDAEGARQGRLIVLPGTTAELEIPGGSPVPIEQLTISITEYTAGPNVAARMPAALPPQTALTYAFELTAEELAAAGATGVRFEGTPLYYYVENFLGFPVGESVPVGRYDRERRVWIPEPNGTIVKIFDIVAGVAVISLDGTSAATQTQLDALGFTELERERLVDLYEVGDELWRVPITHFSSFDCNWPRYFSDDECEPGACGEGGSGGSTSTGTGAGGSGGDSGGEGGSGGDGSGAGPTSTGVVTAGPGVGGGPPDPDFPDSDDNSCESEGSIIECQNQVLGERVELPGTGMTLDYRSSRVPGRLAANTVTMPLTEGNVPASLKRITVAMEVAGRRLEHVRDCATDDCSPGQRVSITWDGLDRFGRRLLGRQLARMSWTYTYPVVYARPRVGPRSFGEYAESREAFGDAVVLREHDLTKQWQGYLAPWNAKSFGLGGWSLSKVHVFDPLTRVVTYGDGKRRTVEEVMPRIRTVPNWSHPQSTVAVLPDGRIVARRQLGGVVIADWAFIDPVTGAAEAQARFNGGQGTEGIQEIATDPAGNIYVRTTLRIWRVDPSGSRTILAGSGVSNNVVCGQSAIATAFNGGSVKRMAVSSAGTVYLSLGKEICRITPHGQLEHVAGFGTISGNRAGDGLLAHHSAVRVSTAGGLAVGGDGAIHFATGDGMVGQPGYLRRISPDGVLSGESGSTTQAPREDLATALLATPQALGIGPDGAMAILQVKGPVWGSGTMVGAVRMISDGAVTTAAGNVDTRHPGCTTLTRNPGVCGAGGPAALAGVDVRTGNVVFSPSGALVVGLYMGIALIEPSLPGLSLAATEFAIPALDRPEADIFDPLGRHIATRHLETGDTVLEITYDAEGRILSVNDKEGVDGTGKVTTITHGSSSVTIAGPFGATTTLGLDENGWATFIQTPEQTASKRYVAEHDAQGLLTSFKLPENAVASEFTYDALGRLIEDVNAVGDAIKLRRFAGVGDWAVELESPSGLVRAFTVADGGPGLRARSVVAPGGAETFEEVRPDGVTILDLPNGATIEREVRPDPRWGMLLPFVAREVTSIDGVPQRTVMRKRDASGLVNPWTFGTLTETTWVNPTLTSGVPTAGSPKTVRTFAASTRADTRTSPGGRTMSRVLDAFGRPVTLAASGVTHGVTLGYDSLGRLRTTTQGSGGSTRTTTRDYRPSDGLLGTVENALGETTLLDWDADGRLISSTRLMDVGGTDDESTFFEYDKSGNPIAIAPPEQPEHAFGHDPRNLATLYAPPSLGTGVWDTTYVYDVDGRLWTETRPPGDVVLTHVYDPVTGNRTSVTRSATEKLAFEYDAANRLEEIHGPSWTGGVPNQSLERSYFGPKLQSEELIGNANGEVSWTYDGHHRVATESVNAGHTVTMGYDADGLLTGAGELVVVREPASGRVQTITNTYGGSTFVEARTYDAFGALETLTYTRGGTTLFAVTYVRDDLGRIATELETVSVALGGTGVEVEIAYAYDLAGRLTTVLRDAVETEFYQYDKNGNRTLAEYDDGAVTRAGAYDDQDRLTTYGPWTATHDDNGTLLERTTTGAGLTDVTYDAFGNLTSIHEEAADILLGYRADGRHRRVSRQVDSDPPTKWIWSSDLRPAAQVDATDAVTHRYVYAEGVNVPDLVIHVSSGERWRLVKDHLGTVRFVVDVGTGDVVRGLEVDAFGRVTASSGDLTAVPFGFAGGLWEPVTGLVRFGARDYDPETGRWTAKDPIRFDGGVNLYAYANNDPVNYLDPAGRQPSAVTDALDDLIPWIPGAAALFPGAAAAAGGVAVAAGVVILCGMTFSGDSQTKCPPCPAPPPPEYLHHTTHGHYPCSGAHTHHNVFVYDQNQVTCQCFLRKVEMLECH